MYAPLLKTVFIVPNILEMFFCLGMSRDFSQSILCVNDRIHPIARLDFASCRNQYRMVLRKFPAAGLHKKELAKKPSTPFSAKSSYRSRSSATKALFFP